MGVKTSGFTELSAKLRQGSEQVRRAIRERIKKEGPAVARLARAMAPVETGDLEHAIQSIQSYDSENHGRLQMEVGIVDQGRAGDYAIAMHEGLQPFGDGGPHDYNLGPGSQAKQAGQQARVGGKFLERALEERGLKLIPEIETIIKQEFD